MAILHDVGLADTIRVRGKECDEHVNPYPDPGKEPDRANICERYIQSASGLEFEISTEIWTRGPAREWVNKHKRNLFAVTYSVDGVPHSFGLKDQFTMEGI